MADKRTKHGMAKTSEYTIWCDMRRRCYDPRRKAYRLYGGRGIKVCDRWLTNFQQFYADMGARPSLKYSLDRIDPNGNYTPENCRWATWKIQQNNRTNNKMITARGETLNLTQWSKQTGIDFRKIHRRLKYGWSPEEALEFTNRILKHICPYCKCSFTVSGRSVFCSAKCRANHWWHKNNPQANYRSI